MTSEMGHVFTNVTKPLWFYIWLKNNDHVSDFLFMNTRSRSDIVFGNKGDHDNFTKFYNKVASWYGNHNDTFFPIQPKHGTYTLSFVEHELVEHYHQRGTNYEEVIVVWEWIAVTCDHPVYITQSGFAFVNENEAVKFKIMKG